MSKRKNISVFLINYVTNLLQNKVKRITYHSIVILSKVSNIFINLFFLVLDFPSITCLAHYTLQAKFCPHITQIFS